MAGLQEKSTSTENPRGGKDCEKAVEIFTVFTGSGGKLAPEVAECLPAFRALQFPGVGIPSGVEPLPGVWHP